MHVPYSWQPLFSRSSVYKGGGIHPSIVLFAFPSVVGCSDVSCVALWSARSSNIQLMMAPAPPQVFTTPFSKRPPCCCFNACSLLGSQPLVRILRRKKTLRICLCQVLFHVPSQVASIPPIAQRFVGFARGIPAFYKRIPKSMRANPSQKTCMLKRHSNNCTLGSMQSTCYACCACQGAFE